MTKSFAYLRCSGLGQCADDKDGFKRQTSSVQGFAANHDYEIVREFREEGVSGKKDETERPAFMEMVGAILENGVRHVLVENLSRLAREYRIQEQLLIYLASKGIQIIACDTGENITEAMNGDPMRKAIIQIQGVFFELERSMLVRKLSVAKERLRAKGIRCEGAHPYGSHPDKPEEKKWVDRAKTLRATMTLREVAAILTSEGAPLRHPSSRWSPNQVRRLVIR